MIDKVLLDKSAEFLQIHKCLSISFLQRKLGISFEMAKRIMKHFKIQ